MAQRKAERKQSLLPHCGFPEVSALRENDGSEGRHSDLQKILVVRAIPTVTLCPFTKRWFSEKGREEMGRNETKLLEVSGKKGSEHQPARCSLYRLKCPCVFRGKPMSREEDQMEVLSWGNRVALY